MFECFMTSTEIKIIFVYIDVICNFSNHEAVLKFFNFCFRIKRYKPLRWLATLHEYSPSE
jgi:hypothetical protein